MFSNKIPFVIMIMALILGVLAFMGDESFTRLQGLENDLAIENEKNQKMEIYVDGLKREVWSLKKDQRTIEESARESLGLARPDEKIFLFKEKQ